MRNVQEYGMEDREVEHGLVETMLSILNAPETSVNGDPNYQKSAYELIKFFDEMPGGFFIYRADEEERILYANNAVLRIAGCNDRKEFDELTGGSFKGFVYPEDLRNVEDSIAEQIRNSVYDFDYVEYRIMCKDGTIRWIEDYGHYIRSEGAGGIFYVFIGDATEKRKAGIAERKQMLQEVKKSRDRLSEVIKEYDKELSLINQEHLRRLEVIEGLGTSYESILYVELNKNSLVPYRQSKRSKCLFYENGPSEYSSSIEKYIEEWVFYEDREQMRRLMSSEYISSRLLSEKAYSVNYRIADKDGIQYLQMRVVNVSPDGSTAQAVIGFRRIDEEIHREIEHRDIMESMLKKAQKAGAAKNAFISNMSHDMRTPLNAIFGFAELAKRHSEGNEKAIEYLNRIEASGRELLDLIDKVLELSWAESAESGLNESRCIISDILAEVYKTMLPLAVQKNILLTVDYPSAAERNVYADKEKLKKLLQHLINNAINYTLKGGKAELTAELSESGKSYAEYIFTVKDTGIGISKEFIGHIYEPFERERNTTGSGISGAGLGLTIVSTIVDMMGGTITAESEPGKGSSFTVKIKFKTADENQKESKASVNAMAKLLENTILLVEDNEINLEIESEILKELGFNIDTAENGAVAVEKVRNSAPGDYALIIMDIQMPVMDGRQAAKQIRRLENAKLAQIPIIALSANSLDYDKQLSAESGMNAHLGKPIDIPLLLETMERVM